MLPEMRALAPTLRLKRLPVAVVLEPGFQYIEKREPEVSSVPVEVEVTVVGLAMAMVPVVVPPMLRVCRAVVAMVPAELKVKLPAEVAEPVSLKIWNLADPVAVSPRAR